MQCRRPGFLRRGLQRFPNIGLRFAILRHRFLSRTIFCIGDSHVRVFNWLDSWSSTKNSKFWPFMVTGATALGLANPNSRTNALERFRFALSNIPRGSSVLFMLGEVDCGYLIWYLSQRDEKPLEEVYERAMANYMEFLDEVRAGNWRLILASAPLPTIRDGVSLGEIANARSEVKATRKERTKLTLRWNASLRSYAAEHHIDFVDTDNWLLDPETHEIRDIFMNRDSANHHLESVPYALALSLALHKIG